MTMEPYRDSTSPPQEVASRLSMLLCPGCGTQVGPVIHPHPSCDRVNGLGVSTDMVPRSEAETLADALERIDNHPGAPDCNGLCADEFWHIAHDAVAEYRARHPKETP